MLSNVKQKLIESFEALAQFLVLLWDYRPKSSKQNDEGLNETEEKKQAEEVVLDVETFLENITEWYGGNDGVICVRGEFF